MEEAYNDAVNQTRIQDDVFTEQVRILHKNLLLSVPASFICSTIILIGSLQVIKSHLIWGWFIAVFFISLFRLIALYSYYRSSQRKSYHLFIFIAGMALSAALWGAAGSILMPQDNLIQQMLIIVIIAGVTAGGMQTLNANLKASMIYICLIIIPLCAWLFIQSGFAYLLLGIAMTTYLLFMLVASVRGHKLLLQALTLQYEKLALFEQLSRSNSKLSNSYKILEHQEHAMVLINKMNEMLQVCQKSNEAYEVVNLSAIELFPGFSGGLTILNADTNDFEIVTQWGNDQMLKSVLTHSDCWALRKNQEYFFNQSANDLMCHHFNLPPNAYICLPLKIQGQITGLLVLYTSLKESLAGYQIQLVNTFREVIQLTLTNIKLHESLYDQAIHDPLTGLFNRRYLDETLGRELQQIIRDKKSLCVAMLDLDHFKNFNDSNGHEAGDEVLKFMGALLKEYFRGSDIACRFGGEEFLVVLINSDLSSANLRLQQFREAVKKNEMHFHGHLLPQITVSIGVAEAPKQGVTPMDIIHAADEALYTAKQTGRDRIICDGSITQDYIQ